MQLVVLAFPSEFGAPDAALDAAEAGFVDDWQLAHAAVVTHDRTGKLVVTTATPVLAQPDPGNWWAFFAAALARGPLGGVYGVAAGALWAAFLEHGIDDRVLCSIVEAMTPGTSGWFLGIDRRHSESVQAYANNIGATFLATELPPEIEDDVTTAIAEAEDRLRG